MEHSKQADVNLLLHHNMAVLLVGPSGSGKSVIIQNAAKKAGRPYSFIAGTRQTTVSNILGFISVNGTYIKSTFRTAYEEGHYFSIEELSAMDANCTLIFNSLENNVMPFPDGYSEPPHKEFRLMATDNPHDLHSSYTGRSKLDAATLDRFDIINVEKDDILEQSLVDNNTYYHMELVRKCLKDVNSSTHISMRDSIRYQKRKDLNLLDGFVEKLLSKEAMALEAYKKIKDELPEVPRVEDCRTLREVWDCVSAQYSEETVASAPSAPNFDKHIPF